MSQEDVAQEVCQDSVTEEETEVRTGKWAGAHQAKRAMMLAKGPASAENHRQGQVGGAGVEGTGRWSGTRVKAQ